MNDVLRVLRRSLRPFGYDIRKRRTLNLSPVKGIETASYLNLVRNNFDYDGGAERKDTSNIDVLKIIFRTSLTEKRNLKDKGRVANKALAEIVERCFLSLIRSVNHALLADAPPRLEMIILDDHSDAPNRERTLRLAAHLKCPWKLQTTQDFGQGSSLHEQFVMARNDDALYYFCEDDYLHDIRAVYEMWAFYKQVYQATRRHLVIHPQEHTALYCDAHYPSYLILGSHRHWRTIADATHTLFAHSHVLRDFWEFFENTKYVGNRKKRRLGSERRTTNRLFDYLPGFAPMPALAGHFQAEDTLPPFFDWQTLWDANDPASLR